MSPRPHHSSSRPPLSPSRPPLSPSRPDHNSSRLDRNSSRRDHNSSRPHHSSSRPHHNSSRPQHSPSVCDKRSRPEPLQASHARSKRVSNASRSGTACPKRAETCQLLKVYGADGKLAGQRWVPAVTGRGALPQQLLRLCLVTHPEATVGVPEWIITQLLQFEIEGVVVAPEQLEKLKVWLLAHRELRKAKGFSSAMKMISGIVPLVATLKSSQ